MPTPKPWSFSSLDKFLTCPRQYQYQYVLKAYQDVPGEEAQWGTWVHKQFENYIRDGVPIPDELKDHRDYMNKLRQQPGTIEAEQKVALNIRMMPTGYFDKDVWWRGIIDYRAVDSVEHKIVDYKTGKMRPKPLQLHMGMLYCFAQGAELVKAEFYWTQTKTTTPIVFPRSHANAIVRGLKPMIGQYAEAWHKDLWPPKPSGLCRGWCPVKECEFYGRGK